jgi:hypothetical protein
MRFKPKSVHMNSTFQFTTLSSNYISLKRNIFRGVTNCYCRVEKNKINELECPDDVAHWTSTAP